jgi:hypothetical protein
MSAHSHAVVWIDHREARVLQFNAAEEEERVLHPRDPAAHIHHHANSIGAGHAAEDQKFLHQVAASLAGVKAALITGPEREARTRQTYRKARPPTRQDHRRRGSDGPSDRRRTGRACAAFFPRRRPDDAPEN